MIKINNIKLPVDHSPEDFCLALAKKLHISPYDLRSFKIIRKSLDSRKKPALYYVYSVETDTKIPKKYVRGDLSFVDHSEIKLNITGTLSLINRPIIIGAGPSGLFCGLYLSRMGFSPLIIERGRKVEDRKKDVERFLREGILDEDSNVSFGEGGAGTFSDGKLNTAIHDREGYVTSVLNEFTKLGADPSIMYEAKPHVGTDRLEGIIKNIRSLIEDNGGEFLFESKVNGIYRKDDRIRISLSDKRIMESNCVVLAVGNASREIFSFLYGDGLHMEAKPIAVGYRVEHPQDMIDEYVYGSARNKYDLPSASYKLTCRADGGRGVYSFCMCPGGYVINSSTERGFLCINGMSYSKRDGKNANSAIIMTVNTDEIEGESPLKMMDFQREIERTAFLRENGRVLRQPFGEYKKDSFGKGLRGILPKDLEQSFLFGMEHFGKIIPGFDDPSSMVYAVESRSSSPVRILRNERMESRSSSFIYPIGEGAGYAGGITSSAADGIKAAMMIAKKYKVGRYV